MHQQLDTVMLEQLECGVCRDIALPPLQQCRNGHVVCNTCRVKLDRCPYCKLPLRKPARNLIFERLAEAVHIPCKFARCRTRVPYSDLAAHMLECVHKPLVCPQSNCGVECDEAFGLVAHLQAKHGAVVEENDVLGRSGEFDRFTLEVQQDPSKRSTWDPIVYLVHKVPYVLNACQSVYDSSVVLTMHEVSREECRARITISFQQQLWKSKVCSLATNTHCISIPLTSCSISEGAMLLDLGITLETRETLQEAKDIAMFKYLTLALLVVGVSVILGVLL